MLHNLYGDVFLGLRSLRKNPILSLTAILTLALGIGANTAIFTMLYGLVLRSLPTPQAWQLVKIGIASAAEPDSEQNSSSIPYLMLQAYQAQQTSFRELSGWSGEDVLMKDDNGTIRNYYGVLISGNAFDLMRIQPYRGRLIAPYDDVRSGPHTGWPVVLNYGFWSERFGRSPDVIGNATQSSGPKLAQGNHRHDCRCYSSRFSRRPARPRAKNIHALADGRHARWQSHVG
jgi:MacB-like periplasmic core domain